MNQNNNLTENPFFIFGCGRSGTSLLSRMLNQHSNIAVPYESHLFNTFYGVLDKYGDLHELDNRQRLINDILRTDVMNDWEPKLYTDEVLKNVKMNDFGGIFDSIMQTWTQKNGKSRWGEKTPHHINYWDEITKIWPNAKIIHIYRDGRDVALSLQNARFGPKTVYASAKYWTKYLDQVQKLKSDIHSDKIVEVSYEDILQDPETELLKICDFIDEKFEPNMLEFYKNKADYNTDNQNKANLKKPIIKENMEKWRKKMTKNEIRVFESIAGSTLTTFGYSRDLDIAEISKMEDLYYSKFLSPIKKIIAMIKNRKGHKDAYIKMRIKMGLFFNK